jgi:hypothetical protein
MRRQRRDWRQCRSCRVSGTQSKGSPSSCPAVPAVLPCSGSARHVRFGQGPHCVAPVAAKGGNACMQSSPGSWFSQRCVLWLFLLNFAVRDCLTRSYLYKCTVSLAELCCGVLHAPTPIETFCSPHILPHTAVVYVYTLCAVNFAVR